MLKLILTGILLICELIMLWQMNTFKRVKFGNILFSVELPVNKLYSEETEAIKENYKKDMALLAAVMIILDLIFWVMPHSSTHSVIMFIVIIIIISFASYIPFIMANRRLRELKEEKRWFVNGEENDCDKCWILGIIYCNRKDPSIRVISRFSGKKAFNMASKKGRAAVVALIILFILVMGSVASYLLYEKSITPEILFHADGTIEVLSTYGQKFPANDIVSVTLVDYIPVTLRKFGTSMEEFSRGKFEVTDCPNSTLYIFNNVRPYIKIKLTDKYIFFNCRTAEETINLYEKLLYAAQKEAA